MIQSHEEYERAVATIAAERERIDGYVEVWKKQGMSDDEIKRLSDPLETLHLGLVEEARAWADDNEPPPGGCMGPATPSREEIAEATAAVWSALRDRGLLTQDEDDLCQPMAENRRRALWLLEKAVEEVLVQDACENF